jgi:hypothetical protein
MNVQQLGTGRVDIGYFFLAAALVGGLTALLSSMVKPLERQLRRRRGEVADRLHTEIEIIQKREILRQSNFGRRLWTAFLKSESPPEPEFHIPGPKFRKATKQSALNRWKKLTTRFGGSTNTDAQADPERQRESDARADQH